MQQSIHWKDRDTSKIKDFEVKTAVSDWTFSTAYKGTVTFLSSQQQRIKNSTSLALVSTKADGKLRCEITTEGIPYVKLGPENPIKHFG